MRYNQRNNFFAKNPVQVRRPAPIDAGEAWATFKALHGDAAAWIERNKGRSTFAADMHLRVRTHGHLTENMMMAVLRSVQMNGERQELQQQAVDNAKFVGDQFTQVLAAFNAARANGINSPKMRLGEITLSRAPDNGLNAGAVYVKANDENKTYLGKILTNKFVRSRDCTDENEKVILDLVSKPKENAIAYGQRTGNCSICARTLTNHASIDQGIGPICAEKMGW